MANPDLGNGERPRTGPLATRRSFLKILPLALLARVEEIFSQPGPTSESADTNNAWTTLCREAIVQPWSPGTGEEGRWFTAKLGNKSAYGKTEQEALLGLFLQTQKSV